MPTDLKKKSPQQDLFVYSLPNLSFYALYLEDGSELQGKNMWYILVHIPWAMCDISEPSRNPCRHQEGT